jgi:mono/diheme cytochrome c family protein
VLRNRLGDAAKGFTFSDKLGYGPPWPASNDDLASREVFPAEGIQMAWIIFTLRSRSARQSILAVTAVWCGALLGGCTVRDQKPLPPSPIAARGSDVDPQGRTQFENYCSGCHAVDGEGVEAEAPPLVGSSWVAGPQDRLIRILLHGVRGAIEIRGKTYNREMPGFGKVLTDTELASLASFVRSQFGGLSTPLEATAISRIRAAQQRSTPWTVSELLEDR